MRLVFICGALVLLVGCRNNGPLSDPFLRTTVPPPGTGAATMAVPPGEAYQGGNAGLPTTPSATIPNGVPAGAEPQPFVVPPKDRYSPAGGFHFQQGRSEPRGVTRRSLAKNQKFPSNQKIDLMAPSSSGLPSSPQRSDDLLSALASAPEANVVGATFKRPLPQEQPPGDAVASDAAGAEPLVTLSPSREAAPLAQTSPTTERLASDFVSLPASSANAPNDKTSLRIVGTSAGLLAAEAASPPVVTNEANRVEAPPASAPGRAPQWTLASNAEMPRAVQTASYQGSLRAAVPASYQIPVAKPAAVPALTPRPGTDYAFDPSYQWLQGKLEYSSSSQQWKLRYIPIDGQTDQYGGSVILAGFRGEGAKPGDLAMVQGSLGGAGGKGYAPAYQIQQLQRIER